MGSYINDRARWIYGRTRAGDAIGQLVTNQPELRDRAIALLSAAMERPTENDLEVNGFLLGELLDLDAVEALPVIRQAFEQEAVDETIAGDWGEVLNQLGQPIDPDDELVKRSHHLYEQRHKAMFGISPSYQAPPPRALPPAPRKAKPDKSKAKRKMSKASRKANKGKKKRK